MNNLDYRKNLNNKYNIKNIDKCKNMLKNINNINNIFFKKLGEGKTGIAYSVKNNCGVIKIFKNKISSNKKPETYYSSKIKKEIFFSSLTRNIIEKNICPNFIYNYSESYHKKMSYILMERANNDVHILFSKNHKTKTFKSILFQIIVGILCMHKIMDINHNDLTLNNIVYKKINKDTIFKYIINDKTYYLPTYGYLIMIIDFEYAHIIKNDINYDFKYVKYIYVKPIINCFKKQNIDTYEKLLNMINDNDKNIINKIINDRLQNNIMTDDPDGIYLFAFYYLVNNNSLNYEKICDQKTINLSNKIKKINIIFDDYKKDLFEIIKDNFKEYEKELKYDKSFIINY